MGRAEVLQGVRRMRFEALLARHESGELSQSEAGEMLGISRAFAYELVARGELPVIKLGRRRLVPKAGLLALVGQSEPEATSHLDQG